MEPYELLDPDCPDAIAFGKATEAEVAIEGLVGEAAFRESLGRINVKALEHKKACARCRSFTPHSVPRDERSPVWGGATLGLLAGLVAGFFRPNYWATVLLSVAIGAIVGFVVGGLSWLLRRPR